MKSASGRILDTKRFPYKDVDPALVKELRQVAKNFIALQDYRHSADYNLTQELEVTDALRQVKLAEEVFTLWPKIETSQIAQNFLVALIVRSRSADRR